MEKLRTHHCGELTETHIGHTVQLMGWVHNVRNLGGVVFIDLRDHKGLTQIVIRPNRPFFQDAANLRPESVIEIKGDVQKRESPNTKIPTGHIEVDATSFHTESPSEILPFPVGVHSKHESEDLRLRYRYLDLRTAKMQKNIIFRSQVIRHIREHMWSQGFHEFQTPILTSSSPEGARDYLVPSRLHPGQFYALPQAPQQFKQLLMLSGFDRYFQIAPCFRDEDARADRSPGEFYQLDMEMAFTTQEEVFAITEGLMIGLFQKFSNKPIMKMPFPRISFDEAMEKYGSDKPDLRNPLSFFNGGALFSKSESPLLSEHATHKALLLMTIPNAKDQSRKFYETMESFAKDVGFSGLPYAIWMGGEDWKGSIIKQLSASEKDRLISNMQLNPGDGVVFVLGPKTLKTYQLAGKLRQKFGESLKLVKTDLWAFCWVVDFPFYEWSEEENRLDFCHNPFSMPKGGLKSLEETPPLEIKAQQYDIVCNGIEISSGAIRNHRRDIMKKAFEIVGYTEDTIQERFPALWNAFQYGAPPHGGIAPGVDRIIMLLLDEPNIREVIAFPLNQKGQDLMMNAPSPVQESQLKDVHLKVQL